MKHRRARAPYLVTPFGVICRTECRSLSHRISEPGDSGVRLMKECSAEQAPAEHVAVWRVYSKVMKSIALPSQKRSAVYEPLTVLVMWTVGPYG